MWKLSLPWWEFVIRGLAVYGFVLVLLRVTGKRQIGQLTPFDLVLLLLLSNAVQNAMNGGDNSISGGLILAVTLVGLNTSLAYLSAHSRRAEALIEGRPQILIHNGQLFADILQRERISRDDLSAAIRRAGGNDIADVRLAILETNGQISVTTRGKSTEVFTDTTD